MRKDLTKLMKYLDSVNTVTFGFNFFAGTVSLTTEAYNVTTDYSGKTLFVDDPRLTMEIPITDNIKVEFTPEGIELQNVGDTGILYQTIYITAED